MLVADEFSILLMDAFFCYLGLETGSENRRSTGGSMIDLINDRIVLMQIAFGIGVIAFAVVLYVSYKIPPKPSRSKR